MPTPPTRRRRSTWRSPATVVTLMVNGIRYLEKPPLPYWLVAIDYRIFGFNAFATHLPEALAVLGCAILGLLWGTPRVLRARSLLCRAGLSDLYRTFFYLRAGSFRKRF